MKLLIIYIVDLSKKLKQLINIAQFLFSQQIMI